MAEVEPPPTYYSDEKPPKNRTTRQDIQTKKKFGMTAQCECADAACKDRQKQEATLNNVDDHVSQVEPSLKIENTRDGDHDVSKGEKWKDVAPRKRGGRDKLILGKNNFIVGATP